MWWMMVDRETNVTFLKVVQDCFLPDAQNKSIRWVLDHGMDCVLDKMCAAPIVILFRQIYTDG